MNETPNLRHNEDCSAEQAARQLEAVKEKYAKQREKENFFIILRDTIGWLIGGVLLAGLFYFVCFKTALFIALKILAGIILIPLILSSFNAAIEMGKWLFNK